MTVVHCEPVDRQTRSRRPRRPPISQLSICPADRLLASSEIRRSGLALWSFGASECRSVSRECDMPRSFRSLGLEPDPIAGGHALGLRRFAWKTVGISSSVETNDVGRPDTEAAPASVDICLSKRRSDPGASLPGMRHRYAPSDPPLQTSEVAPGTRWISVGERQIMCPIPSVGSPGHP